MKRVIIHFIGISEFYEMSQIHNSYFMAYMFYHSQIMGDKQI